MKNINKLGDITIKLAMYFITIEENSKIKSINVFMHEFNVGRGTIQKALSILENNKCIELSKNGRHGTILTKKNINKLIIESQTEYINGVMPLPYTTKYEALASSLVKYYTNKYDIKFFLSFTRSSKDRIKMVEENLCSFAVVSLKYAQELVNTSNKFDIAYNFPINSYTSNHGLICLANNSKKENINVGVDFSSDDHSFLVNSYLQIKGYNFINVPYNQLLTKLQNSEIDVTIMNLDQKFNDEFKVLEIKDSVELTQASIVCLKENVVFKCLKPTENEITKMMNFQQLILNNEILPSY